MSIGVMALIGFVSWWGTGIEDTFAFSLMLKQTRRSARPVLIAGNLIAVGLLLVIASLGVLGLLTLAPALLHIRLFNIPLQNLAGLLPILIGGRSLWLILSGRDDDDDDQPESTGQLLGVFLIGMQVYLLNAIDDLGVHLGILSGSLKPPANTAGILVSYALGNLIGAITSIAAARWLAAQMQTRRTLELIAAVSMILVGVLIVFGIFTTID
jgi:hypothetical protein